ncbi:MAG: Transcriptional regulator PerR [Candidatus Hydrogenedentes bacterium ADurb.Bin101]|nr:MAG: Transcriptional regulator PerR [Candidatus Hydrogenedentes bacterium ADurb.Bin101]
MEKDGSKDSMDAFARECRDRGLKVTYQRMEIFRVAVSTDEHPDAVTVHKRVKKRIPTISLDTVYRNLKLLAAHGLLAVVGTSGEHLRFDANRGPHHHFTCVRCGMIRDFTSEVLAALPLPREAQDLGVPLSQHLEVKGICVACEKKEQRKKEAPRHKRDA